MSKLAPESLLTIHGDCTSYIIEPARFDSGLTRVQMIDDHLARLIKDGRGDSKDVDILLDARTVFEIEEGIGRD